MKVFNPTGWKIEAKASGVDYVINPFSEEEIYDVFHVEHILGAKKFLGLVSLEYGKKAQEKFPKFEDYKKYQEIEGLKKVLAYKERCLMDEKQAEKEAKAHGSTADVENIAIKKFEKEIDLVKKWLKEAGYVHQVVAIEDVVADRPAWNKEVKNEPRTNENKGSNTAR